ncbi:uncharacterized protein BYT42DRAFT_224717 [Radiomyces spectabilis]|uniref:uncharacterized protein n=1 Tax=Radiomyces spectabilis TaxID=64574 RepID=UPI00221F3FFD|nr:uncharacterized protein BYT42DRAFT_224717 [Radiomyces spectabilis]KAI8388170.1 hypothetical protein BYT42DRAFT_224717 [Radiomyces spectabilis]
MRLSLAAIGLLTLFNTQFVAKADVFSWSNKLAVIHGDAPAPTANEVSASYLAPFANEHEPEVDFELVEHDDDDTASNRLSVLRKRGDDCGKYYSAKRGDTCGKISKKYGIKLDQFYDMNPQVNHACTNLHTGKKYCVETGSTAPSHKRDESGSGCAKTHKVSGSDTCVKLAKKYGISVNEFYDMNPQVHRGSCDNLDNGKQYCVKAGSSGSKFSGKVASFSEDSGSKKSASKKSSSKKSSSKKSSSKKSSSSSSSSSKEKRKKLQSKAAFTYYWIAHPDDYKGGKSVAVKTCGGKTIGKVGEKYADALVMEGTGVVGNKIVNLGGCSCSGYKCFEEVDKKDDPYGLTAYGSALRPYITIAANDLKKNTKIYVPSIVGWTLPGTNKKHNGCLLVDDQSWSFSSHHIDFYVYSMKHYKSLDKQHRVNKVDIYEGGSCKLLNYL